MTPCERALIRQDFYLTSRWEVDKSLWRLSKSQNKLVPSYVKDLETGCVWWNESAWSARYRCVKLFFKALIIDGALFTVFRAGRLVTGSHLWYKAKCRNSPYHNMSMSKRWGCAGEDLKQLLISPIVLLGQLLSALYGIITPRNGLKLFSNIERAVYEVDYRARCAQPKCKYDRRAKTVIHSEFNNGTWTLSVSTLERGFRYFYTAERLKKYCPDELRNKTGDFIVQRKGLFRDFPLLIEDNYLKREELIPEEKKGA